MSVSASVPEAGAEGLQAAKTKAGVAAWCRSIGIYLLFCAYGAGSSWWVVSISWLQLPVYQERFGLDTASKMAVGYQIGALAVPCFILVRFLLGLLGRSIWYPALIPTLLVAHAAVLSLGIVDAHYLWVPVWMNILGGLLGYVTEAAHQGYILTNYDVFYVGAFWTGNDIACLYAAAISLVQEPGLGEEGRRFGPRMFYLMSLHITPMSLLAFAYLHRVIRPSGLAKPVGDKADVAAAPLVAPGRKADAAETAEMAGETPLLAADQLEDGSSVEKAAEAPLGPAEQLEKAAPRVAAEEAGEAPLAPADQLAKASLTEKVEEPEAAGRCGWLPRGLRRQTATSVAVAFIFAWLQFCCWGVGDPISSYACANGSREDKGLACTAGITEGSILVGLLGRLASSATLLLGRRCLAPLITVLVVMFTGGMALVVLAAAFGGMWSSLGGEYIVAVMLWVRFVFSYVVMLTVGLVQSAYVQSELEGMNLFFAVIGQGSSVLGTTLVCTIISESGGK